MLKSYGHFLNLPFKAKNYTWECLIQKRRSKQYKKKKKDLYLASNRMHKTIPDRRKNRHC